MADFFAMGGYALYVWPSYAVAFLVLAANIVLPIMRLRRFKRTFGQDARDPRIKNASVAATGTTEPQ